MKTKTSELEGAALDWAVAYATNGGRAFFDAFGARMLGRSISQEVAAGNVRPSTDWSQGGPLIERFRVSLSVGINGRWCAVKGMPWYADAPLIAAMRAIVASELGDEVDVPEELLP